MREKSRKVRESRETHIREKMSVELIFTVISTHYITLVPGVIIIAIPIG